MTITSYNPRTGQANGTVVEMSPHDVRAVVERASSASSAVAAASPRQRRGWLHAVAAALVANTRAGQARRIRDRAGLHAPHRRGIARSRSAALYGDVAAQGSYLAATIDHPTSTHPA